MNCPHCGIPLMMAERKGIEIDFCSQCRGIWLDKCELDKIIELSVNERFGDRNRSSMSNSARAYSNDPYVSQRRPEQPRYYGSHGHKHGYKYDKGHYKYKKKKTLLGEIFDIFD